MPLKRTMGAVLVMAVMGLAGCTNTTASRHAEGFGGNPNTPAGKAGKVAYKVGKEAEKAAKEAERKLDKAARDAQAGWNSAQKTPSNP